MSARPELHVITEAETEIETPPAVALAVVVAPETGEAEPVALDRLLGADSPRLSGESREHTLALAEQLRLCPPILVNRRTMQVVDGVHRVHAARARGEATIDAVFVDVDPDEAFLLAVRANTTHGLPLSLADRRAAAVRILAGNPAMSDRAVARATGLAPNTVGAIRLRSTVQCAQSNTARTGSDGRARPESTVEARRRAGAILSERPDTPLRQVARETGLSLGTAHDVRERLRHGRDPVPDGQRVRRAPRRRDRVPREPVAWSAIRAQFVKDPVVRYADSGRAVVRWLDARATDREEWRDMVDDVPDYWVDAMIDVAASCAREWQQFARELGRRSNS
ncbi:ParB/RepB/Spo0J family partition protein [Amycolatopsis sp. NPDC026612]|uniref:ParB/RepB/Spo0J family partition protein n=1 Tax=Amycolatopsis sp. NPDC026612 TaxID=3155466 RepID=UPI00340D1BC2